MLALLFQKKINPLKPRGALPANENYVYYRYAEVLLNYAEARMSPLGPMHRYTLPCERHPQRSNPAGFAGWIVEGNDASGDSVSSAAWSCGLKHNGSTTSSGG